jgi:DNA primase
MKTEPILCISLGGVCDSALKTTLANSPDIIQIVMCLDNDAAGNSACEKIAQSYGDKYTLIRCLPQHKDFNEDLVASINESEPLNNVVQELEEDDSYELHT